MATRFYLPSTGYALSGVGNIPSDNSEGVRGNMPLKRYENSSLDLTLDFFDKEGDPIQPETLTWSVGVVGAAEPLDSDTIVPTAETYDLSIPTTLNVLSGDENELRVVVVNWKYNNGVDGDTMVYYYKLLKAG